MTNKVILGTAQFGLNYGINNTVGKPSEKYVFEILDFAHERGIKSLETADVYGNALEIIGQYHKSRDYQFNLLNKFKNIKEGCLYDNVMKSLDNLQIPQFEVYSYHSFTEYSKHAHLKDELLSIKNKGLIKKIGISVYTNKELNFATLDEEIDVIQLPFNLLDNQNKRGESIDLAKINGKDIHVRSVFLQGLLFMNENLIPEKLVQLKKYINEIQYYCRLNGISLQSLALSYAIYNGHIDQVLIGVDTKEQLKNNLESVIELKEAFDYINCNINVTEKELLNPKNWS